MGSLPEYLDAPSSPLNRGRSSPQLRVEIPGAELPLSSSPSLHAAGVALHLVEAVLSPAARLQQAKQPSVLPSLPVPGYCGKLWGANLNLEDGWWTDSESRSESVSMLSLQAQRSGELPSPKSHLSALRVPGVASAGPASPKHGGTPTSGGHAPPGGGSRRVPLPALPLSPLRRGTSLHCDVLAERIAASHLRPTPACSSPGAVPAGAAPGGGGSTYHHLSLPSPTQSSPGGLSGPSGVMHAALAGMSSLPLPLMRVRGTHNGAGAGAARRASAVESGDGGYDDLIFCYAARAAQDLPALRPTPGRTGGGSHSYCGR